MRLIALLVLTLLLSACGELYMSSESPSFGCMDPVAGSIEKLGCNFMEGSKKDHCYQDAAVRTGDPEACKRIQHGPPKDKCYMRVAVVSEDSSICGLMEDVPGGYAPAECFYRVAANTGDSSYCDKITKPKSTWGGTYSKETCLENLADLKAQDEEYKEPTLHEEDVDPKIATSCQTLQDCKPVCIGSESVSRMCHGSSCVETKREDCSTQRYTYSGSENSDMRGKSAFKECIKGTCRLGPEGISKILAETYEDKMNNLISRRDQRVQDLKKTGRTPEYYDALNVEIDILNKQIAEYNNKRRQAQSILKNA